MLAPVIIICTLMIGTGVQALKGGEVAELGQWPAFGKLERKSGRGLFCCTTLIRPGWAVTARHCLGTGPKDRTLALGYVKLGDRNRQVYKYDYAYAHPDVDLSVIRLAQPVNLTNNPNVAPVRLAPPDEYNYNQTDCFGVGHSKLANGKFVTSAQFDVVLPRNITKNINNIYTADKSFGRDSGLRSGDSGGPLLCERDGEFVLVGVASIRFGRRHRYTRISRFHDWILRKIGE